MANLILNQDKNKSPISISVFNPTSEDIQCNLFAPKYSLPNNPLLKIDGANGVTYDFIQNEIMTTEFFIGKTKMATYDFDYKTKKITPKVLDWTTFQFLNKQISGHANDLPISLGSHISASQFQSHVVDITLSYKVNGASQLSFTVPAFTKIDFVFYPSLLFEFLEIIKSSNHPFSKYLLGALDIAINNYSYAASHSVIPDYAYTYDEANMFKQTVKFKNRFDAIRNSIMLSNSTLYKDFIDLYCLCNTYTELHSGVIYSLKNISEKHFENIYHSERNRISDLTEKANSHLNRAIGIENEHKKSLEKTEEVLKDVLALKETYTSKLDKLKSKKTVNPKAKKTVKPKAKKVS